VRQTSAGTIAYGAAPGELLHQEFGTCDTRDDLLKAIAVWVDRLDAELRAIPVNREIEDQRRMIEELTAAFSTQSEGYYSGPEAAELAERLSSIEERLEATIRGSSATDGEGDGRLDQLHTEIELLKSQLGSLSKENWSRSAAIRVAAWLKDPESRKVFGADPAKQFLLPPGSTAD
jgi:hypothetical protein